MNAIQFKKTNCQLMGSNVDEITTKLGGMISYTAKCGTTDIQKTYERNDQIFQLQFNDWIMDINGVILVLSEKQYQAFKSLSPFQKSLGDLLAKAVREVIKKEQKHGGLLR